MTDLTKNDNLPIPSTSRRTILFATYLHIIILSNNIDNLIIQYNDNKYKLLIMSQQLLNVR